MSQVKVSKCRKARFHRHRPVPGSLLILASACCLQFLGHPAESQDFQDLTVHEFTLGSRPSATWIEAIDDGRAVGWGRIAGEHAPTDIHAFLWTEAAGVRDLGTLGGNHSEAHAVDGDRVVGFSTIEIPENPENPENPEAAEVHAFIWTPAGGMRDLGTLGGDYSAAFGVSGGQVVGESETASGETHAFRWTAAEGMVDLGTLADGTRSSAVAIHNGLVAGWSTTKGDPDPAREHRTRRPVAWTAAGEIVDIVGKPFDLQDDGFVRGSGEATDVRDGMVVGRFKIPAEPSPCEPEASFCNLTRAFAWTAAGGMVNLGLLPGDNFAGSVAVATSGGQVVGESSGAAFSWTASGGMIDLGTLGGSAEALDVSNGRVVGFFLDVEGDFDNENAFLWTPETGMVDVSPFRPSRAARIDEAGRIAVTQNMETVSDFAGGRAAVLVPAGDADEDGVADAGDDCPDSIVRQKVVIDGCNSGVPNTVSTNGCTISDSIADCAAESRNHGQFVSCVSRLTNDLRTAGTISGQQRRAIQRCAAGSNLP